MALYISLQDAHVAIAATLTALDVPADKITKATRSLYHLPQFRVESFDAKPKSLSTVPLSGQPLLATTPPRSPRTIAGASSRMAPLSYSMGDTSLNNAFTSSSILDFYVCDIHAPECFETLPKSAEYDNGLNDTEYLLPPVLPKETNNAGGCAPPLENVELDKDHSLDQDLSLC